METSIPFNRNQLQELVQMFQFNLEMKTKAKFSLQSSTKTTRNRWSILPYSHRIRASTCSHKTTHPIFSTRSESLFPWTSGQKWMLMKIKLENLIRDKHWRIAWRAHSMAPLKLTEIRLAIRRLENQFWSKSRTSSLNCAAWIRLFRPSKNQSPVLLFLRSLLSRISRARFRKKTSPSHRRLSLKPLARLWNTLRPSKRTLCSHRFFSSTMESKFLMEITLHSPKLELSQLSLQLLKKQLPLKVTHWELGSVSSLLRWSSSCATHCSTLKSSRILSCTLSSLLMIASDLNLWSRKLFLHFDLLSMLSVCLLLMTWI